MRIEAEIEVSNTGLHHQRGMGMDDALKQDSELTTNLGPIVPITLGETNLRSR